MVLFLNDIGTGEVVLILAFILIFFGAKSIPGLARTFGRTIRQIKDASADLQSEIKKSANDMKGDLNLQELIDDTKRDLQRPLDQYAADIEDVMKRTPTHSQPQQRKIPSPTPESTPDTVGENGTSTPPPVPAPTPVPEKSAQTPPTSSDSPE